MDHDSTDHPEPPRKVRRGSQPDLPPQELTAADVDPATSAAEEDDDARLPEAPEEPAEAIAEGPLAVGHAAIENAVRLAPTSPGVYRMLNAGSDVLYVGKAKNVRKRLASYARVNAPLPARILRMIAATVTVEIISTTTETEALLLEANLIKQLRPRFNVQLRDDKSFPYILISGDHWAPQILKHRGAQTRPGRYFGPFASAGAMVAKQILLISNPAAWDFVAASRASAQRGRVSRGTLRALRDADSLTTEYRRQSNRREGNHRVPLGTVQVPESTT